LEQAFTDVVKREYVGGFDLEQAFTEVLTKALIKLPQLEKKTKPCPPRISA
jgi:hypothetical protein